MEIIFKNRLKAEEVREVSEALLKQRLSLEVDGYKLTMGMALNVLMKAAIEKRSIEAVCADLTEVVDSKQYAAGSAQPGVEGGGLTLARGGIQ